MRSSLEDGTKKAVRWEDGMVEPGWTKLDWVVADPQRGRLATASNLLDVTWEGPNGEIIPLDGFIDPYFQEIYLDATSVPLFSKVVREVDENALVKYADRPGIRGVPISGQTSKLWQGCQARV